MSDELKVPEWVIEFERRFSDNIVYWQELRNEIAIGDPDFTSMRKFIRDLLTEKDAEIAEMKGNYERACQTIAAMHAAAMGEVTGPNRGVVEDVADLRAERDRLQGIIDHLKKVGVIE